MNTDERLAVIETKLDNLAEILHDHHGRQDEVADKQDVRIRSLERFRNIAIGVVAVTGSGAFWRYLL